MIIKILTNVFYATVFYPVCVLLLIIGLIMYCPLLVVFLQCLAKLSIEPLIALWRDIEPYLTWGKAACVYSMVLVSSIAALRA